MSTDAKTCGHPTNQTILIGDVTYCVGCALKQLENMHALEVRAEQINMRLTELRERKQLLHDEFTEVTFKIEELEYALTDPKKTVPNWEKPVE